MLLNAQRAREIPDLVLLGFEVIVLLVGQNEAQSQESCFDERKLVLAAIPDVLLANGGIDLSRKQVIHPGILPIDLGRSVFISEEFSGKRIGTVSALGGGKIQILLCGEIARVIGDDVNEAGFGLGVAELCEGMDIVFGYFHGTGISLVRGSKLRASDRDLGPQRRAQICPLKTEAGQVLCGTGFKVGIELGLRIPVMTFYTWNGDCLEGKGIEPDYTVELSRDTLKEGKDPQLQKAVEVARQL